MFKNKFSIEKCYIDNETGFSLESDDVNYLDKREVSALVWQNHRAVNSLGEILEYDRKTLAAFLKQNPQTQTYQRWFDNRWIEMKMGQQTTKTGDDLKEKIQKYALYQIFRKKQYSPSRCTFFSNQQNSHKKNRTVTSRSANDFNKADPLWKIDAFLEREGFKKR